MYSVTKGKEFNVSYKSVTSEHKNTPPIVIKFHEKNSIYLYKNCEKKSYQI